jgi:copper chaperone CopZ
MKAGTVDLTVKGMTCDNCARSVERKLAATPGVTKAKVDLQGAQAHVEYDADLVKPEVLANAVRQLGYDVPA